MIPGLALPYDDGPRLDDGTRGTGRIRIIGIDGSPRHGNTNLVLTEALRAARDAANVDAEIVRVAKERIRYCSGCSSCHLESKGTSGCGAHRDAMDWIVPKLLESDAIILATPVYFAGPTAQLKTFMDRTEPLLRYGSEPLRSALRNKVGAGIVVGGNRNGGQESALQALLHFFLIHDMFVIGTGPDPSPGCYLGAAAWGVSDVGESSASEDKLGLRAAGIVGRRLVEAVARVSDRDLQ